MGIHDHSLSQSSDPFSLAECRRLLGSLANGFSDAEVERIRGQFYALAGFVVEAAGQNSDNGEASMLALVPEDDLYGVEERAAVLECDAKMTREFATRAALGAYMESVKRKSRRSGPS